MKRFLAVFALAALSACVAMPDVREVREEPLLALAEGPVFVDGAPLSISSTVLMASMGQNPVGYKQTTQTLTGDVPSATSSDWFALGSFKKIRVYVCADTAARTLSGAGALRAFYKHDATGLVMRNPSLDLSVTVTATSCDGAACRCQVFPDMATGGNGFVYYMSDGVTTSAGTQDLVGVIGGLQ